jgi:hypothetical protein
MPKVNKFEQHELGFSWTQADKMLRGSHALVHDGKVWLVDPVDSEDHIERAIDGNTPAGVIQLLDRHNRDCEAIADRLGVTHHSVPDELPGAPFTMFSLIDRAKWREVGIWWPEFHALVVAEAVGTTKEMEVAHTGIAVHPLLRLTPPGALRKYTDVNHLLPGHGEPTHDPRTGDRLQEALDRSRTDIPRFIARVPKMIKAGLS